MVNIISYYIRLNDAFPVKKEWMVDCFFPSSNTLFKWSAKQMHFDLNSQSSPNKEYEIIVSIAARTVAVLVFSSSTSFCKIQCFSLQNRSVQRGFLMPSVNKPSVESFFYIFVRRRTDTFSFPVSFASSTSVGIYSCKNLGSEPSAQSAGLVTSRGH